MTSLSIRAGLLSLALGFCLTSYGAALVTQAPNQVSGDNMSDVVVADNFSLGFTANINNIRFWSIHASDNASESVGSVYWAIHSNAGGSPGAVLFTGTPAAAGTNTGLSTGFGYFEFVFDIPVAFQLTAGDYWLALHNGPLTATDAVEMLWETSSAGVGPPGQYDNLTDVPDAGWISTDNEHAFRIDGERVVIDPPGVPEPSTLALLIGALVASRSATRSIRQQPRRA
jgi:hypothetical protein